MRADEGAAAAERKHAHDEKELRRQVQRLQAQLDDRDRDLQRQLEGGRATRHNPAAAWAPADLVSQLQERLLTAERSKAKSESKRASEVKRLREAEAEINRMRADHHEARQWIEDKADVHADVLAVEAKLKASRKGETMHLKQLGVVNSKFEDVMASQHLERKGTKLLNKTVEKLKSTSAPSCSRSGSWGRRGGPTTSRRSTHRFTVEPQSQEA